MQSVSIQTGGSEKRRSIVGMCGLDKGAQLLIIGIGGQRAVRCQHKGDVLHPLQGIAGQRSDLLGLVLTEQPLVGVMDLSSHWGAVSSLGLPVALSGQCRMSMG